MSARTKEKWYIKEGADTWPDYIWRIVDVVTLGAMLSAAVWCIVWVVGFFIVLSLSNLNGFATDTSAFLLTITVLLSHLPKFVAMFLGTDTDFQNFKGTIGEFSFRNAPWPRAVFSVILIVFVIYLLKDAANVTRLSVNFDPNNFSEIRDQTWSNFRFCLLLFAIQVVFSFPKDGINSVEGRILGP